MKGLGALCRAAAAKMPGAKAFPDGGLVFRRSGFDGRVEFAARSWDVVFDTHELAVEPLEISPAGLWHDVRGAFGFRDVQLGDAEFDAAFEVQCATADAAAALLRPWLRKRLRDVALHGGFRWRLSRAGSLLRVAGLPATAVELDRWMSLAFDLLSVLPGADGKDRVALGAARVRVDAESTCGVCGGPLAEGGLVRCGKCRTPHHADCWAFNGRCSIFACGGTAAI